MMWVAGALAGAAIAGLAITWWRRRHDAGLPGTPFRISAAGQRGEKPSKPFMPPPAPMAAPPDNRGADKRAHYRRIGNSVMILVADDDETQPPFNAWVIDRSRQGLRIAAERELKSGRKFTVRPVQAPPTTPWSIIEVRHCASVDGHWEVGCRFLQPPPIQIMTLFG